MDYGAVIVAAGMSRRMKDFKQLMKIGDLTFAELVISTFRQAGVGDIVVVTGYRGEELEKALAYTGVSFLRNDRYETTEMFDSILMGLDFLKDRCDFIFFCPVDVPLFTEETVKAEMEAAGQADVLVPCCRERGGHPLLLNRKAVRWILHDGGERGLRGAYERLEECGEGKVLPVHVEDEGAVMDADTKEEYHNLLNLYHARLIKAASSDPPA